MKAFVKRLIDGALRRLGLVRKAVAAAQTVDAVYLSTLGRTPSLHERAEGAAALSGQGLTVADLIDRLSDSGEGKARLWDAAHPLFVEAGYATPQVVFEQVVQIAFLAVFGRPPEPDALSAYEGALRTGRLSVDSFLAELLSTQEADGHVVRKGYANARGQLKGAIQAVFKAALGRSADDDALEAFVNAIEAGDLTLDLAIEELSTCAEAKQRAFNLLKPALEDYGYFSKAEHYRVVANAIFQSIMGRPLDDPEQTFAGDFIVGRLTVETAIQELMDSEEVRLRVLHTGLPDVLEGIYRTAMRQPETDPALRSLILSAASQRTFEIIKNMCLSAETRHYLMRPIIKAHRQQFLT